MGTKQTPTLYRIYPTPHFKYLNNAPDLKVHKLYDEWISITTVHHYTNN